MKLGEKPLTLWSPAAMTRDGLRRCIEQLRESVSACIADASESTAVICCENSRLVSDTIECLVHEEGSIDSALLSDAIAAIVEGVKAVRRVDRMPETPDSAKPHLKDIINSMDGRRQDLVTLQVEGKTAFMLRS